MVNALRGMNDLVGLEAKKYHYFITNASRILENYGFEFVRTPILEESALFKRSVGDSSDIVGKEMYQFIDKGQNDVCLRPEGTAGVVRSFVEQKLDRAGGIHRWYYFGTMYRYERPQKGRLREFTQLGAESFGVQSAYEDATIILAIKSIFEFFNISFTLQLNSLGCDACMPQYKANLKTKLVDFKASLCEDCHRRTETNPIRTLDCKNEHCQKILVDFPKITDHLCTRCEADFKSLQAILDANNVAYTINKQLVRGLDYYTKTAFEFTSTEIGAQSAIAGGGRYDKLVSQLDGKATPAIGFAIGIERIMDLITLPESARKGWYFGYLDEPSAITLYTTAIAKTKTDTVFIEYNPKKLAKHLESAAKKGMEYCAIIGENERVEGKIWVKNLQTNQEELKKIDEL